MLINSEYSPCTMAVQQQVYAQELPQKSIETIDLLCQKWTAQLLWTVALSPQRFSQVQRRLKMSSKTLSKRLKLLEKEGIVTKTIYAEVPVRVEYELTEKGYELKSIIETILSWEQKW